jgi:hypothetical protein
VLALRLTEGTREVKLEAYRALRDDLLARITRRFPPRRPVVGRPHQEFFLDGLFDASYMAAHGGCLMKESLSGLADQDDAGRCRRDLWVSDH